MTPTEEIPFEEMCHHAMDSLLVNGLTPSEWRWGADAIKAFRQYRLQMANYAVSCAPPPNLPKGALLIWHDLPSSP